MSNFQYFLYAAAAFGGCIAAYPALAAQHRWHMGSIYSNGISVVFYLGTMVIGLCLLAVQAYNAKTSWFSLLWFIGSSFFGPTWIPVVFREYSGSVSIFFAIALSISAFVVLFIK